MEGYQRCSDMVRALAPDHWATCRREEGHGGLCADVFETTTTPAQLRSAVQSLNPGLRPVRIQAGAWIEDNGISMEHGSTIYIIRWLRRAYPSTSPPKAT